MGFLARFFFILLRNLSVSKAGNFFPLECCLRFTTKGLLARVFLGGATTDGGGGDGSRKLPAKIFNNKFTHFETDFGLLNRMIKVSDATQAFSWDH